MPRRFLIAVLVLSAVLINTLPAEPQSAYPARTFAKGPLSVTVFDGTRLGPSQFLIEFPVGAGRAVKLLTIPVDVTVPPQQRSFLVVQFVGHFVLDSIPVTIALDCVVNSVIDPRFGCGQTPATDLDLTGLAPNSGLPHTIVPATFLIHDLPAGMHEIGIAVEADTSLGEIGVGRFIIPSSSLIVSLYTEKKGQ